MFLGAARALKRLKDKINEKNYINGVVSRVSEFLSGYSSAEIINMKMEIW